MFTFDRRRASIPLVLLFTFYGGCAAHLGQNSVGQVHAQDKNLTPAASQSAKSDTVGAGKHPAMTNPALANKQAPDKYKVKFETTKGDFVIQVDRTWSPNGADRFYNLVDIGYFRDIAIFRAIEGFMFQFGIHGDPIVSKKWRDANIKDDPKVGVSNRPGFISFANAGPNTRSAQMFINLGDNRRLDEMGFTPFGQVVDGQDVVLKINTEYGENPPDVQASFQAQGNSFILKRFPKLDLIKSVTLVEQSSADAETQPTADPPKE